MALESYDNPEVILARSSRSSSELSELFARMLSELLLELLSLKSVVSLFSVAVLLLLQPWLCSEATRRGIST